MGGVGGIKGCFDEIKDRPQKSFPWGAIKALPKERGRIHSRRREVMGRVVEGSIVKQKIRKTVQGKRTR